MIGVPDDFADAVLPGGREEHRSSGIDPWVSLVDVPLGWLLGPASGGGACPVCGGTIANWVWGDGAVVIDHARRNYPCRLPVGGASR